MINNNNNNNNNNNKQYLLTLTCVNSLVYPIENIAGLRSINRDIQLCQFSVSEHPQTILQLSFGTTKMAAYGNHYENTPIQIYRNFHIQKLKIFR